MESSDKKGVNPTVNQERSDIIWVAYHSDFSDSVVFLDELSCLRYAVENFMSVISLYSGQSLVDAVRSKYVRNHKTN